MTSQFFSRRIAFILACLLALGVGSPVTGVAQEPAEWRTAYLTQSAVLDVTITDDGSGWAVGEAGTILHYDGASWQRAGSPTDETLHAAAFASADDGWAVGKAGTILRYEDRDWRSVTEPITAADELFDVALVNAGGWAVGQRFDTVSETFEGLILRLSDGTWTEVPTPQARPLRAAAFASADEGWAVGEAGTVLRWDGVAWTEANSPTDVDLYDVAVVGDNVWAAGDKGILVRWNQQGSRVELTPYEVTFTGVEFAGSDAGWVVGTDGTILRYNGNTWSLIEMSLSTDLSGLFVDTDGIPWVTGDGGLIGRVTPDGWQFATQPYVDVDLTAIDVRRTTAGWAVGGRPFPPTEGVVFWQQTARAWNPQEVRDASPLFDIDVLSEDEVWAVGQDFLVEDPSKAGVVWRYTAGAWATASHPDVSALFAVEAVGPGDVWAAGQDGSLVHYDGTDWQRTPIPENVHLYGLHFRAPSDGWAVGEQFELVDVRYLAVAFHYDGAMWQPITVPDTAWEDTTDSTRRPRLLAVHALSENDVWAVGNAGAILHYDGVQWTVVQGEQDYSLLDVNFSGPGDGWTVGTQGAILRFHGSTWVPTDSPTTETLNGIVSRPWGEAWAVGSQGTFLYHPGVAPWDVYLPLTGR